MKKYANAGRIESSELMSDRIRVVSSIPGRDGKSWKLTTDIMYEALPKLPRLPKNTNGTVVEFMHVPSHETRLAMVYDTDPEGPGVYGPYIVTW